MNATVNIRSSIAKLNSLPAMPVIAQKLLALSLDTDEGEAQMLKLIGQDPLITAKIVGLANTPIFGVTRKVSTINDAAMLLGFSRVRSVAIGIATMSALTKLPEGHFKANDLWMNSMATAVTMRTIARAMPARARPMEDQIFLAGLLHDIGYMALAFLDTHASNALHAQLQSQPERPILEIEQELLGITHSEIGAQLAHHWHLPEDIITVIRHHHTPDEEDAKEGQPMVRLVSFAEKMFAEEEISEAEWLELGVDSDKAENIRSQMDELTEQAKQLAV
jgi:putative nucleotidyltransferase with HDIG domain